MATFNTRIQSKIDTYAQWMANDPILLKGELAIATIPAATGAVKQEPATLLKVGNGADKFSALPFISARAADVAAWALADTKPTYEAAEIVGLSDYISGEIQDSNTTYNLVQDGMDSHILILQKKEVGETEWTEVTRITTADSQYDSQIAENAAAISALSSLVGSSSVAEQIGTAIDALKLDETYEQKGAAAQALMDAKSYTDAKVGTVESTVAALSSNVASTYETQTDAAEKLQKAKDYADSVASGKADTNHHHDDRYYTETETNALLVSLETKSDASDKLAEAKSYADAAVSGLITATAVDQKMAAHNTATGTHNDIRALISDLNTKVTNFLDVDEETTDQLSEVLEMIEANKGTIESLTTSKVSVSDIANNLTTNSAGRVLSAAQGVYIQGLINGVDNELETHATDTSNPHGVTKAQVGLSKVDNTADASKPVSAAQAIAIADAKSAGTQAQTNLTTHVNTKTNPHGVTCAQIGAVANSGDIMTGRLQLNMDNPHIHMKDTGYSTDWYFQAYQDQLAFGPTFANAVKTDKNGNMTVPGMTNSTKFVSSQGLAVTQTDGASGYGIALYGSATPQTYGLWFGKTATYGTHGSVTSDWATYFGMNSGATTRGWVFRREDGCVASISGSGNLTLNGSAKIGNAVTMAYDSANECLNFAFA